MGQGFKQIVEDLKAADVSVYCANVAPQIIRVFRRANLLTTLETLSIHSSIESAVVGAQTDLLEANAEADKVPSDGTSLLSPLLSVQ